LEKFCAHKGAEENSMPDLKFKVTGVEPAARGLVPLLHFNLDISNEPATESIQAVMIQAQIQIQSAQRAYHDGERAGLEELFGTPDRWGQTLRNRLWTLASTTVPPFTGERKVKLPVQCTYDFNVIATKYFYALDGGEVPLLFLFSGTVFYAGPNGQLQVQQISWDKECVYRMPVKVWAELMDHHYPNCAWVSVRRDVFDQLNEFKRQHGLLTWEQAFELLLSESRRSVGASSGTRGQGGSVAKVDLSRPSVAKADLSRPSVAEADGVTGEK
jgi:Family of unknown function (DUF6084)